MCWNASSSRGLRPSSPPSPHPFCFLFFLLFFFLGRIVAQRSGRAQYFADRCLRACGCRFRAIEEGGQAESERKRQHCEGNDLFQRALQVDGTRIACKQHLFEEVRCLEFWSYNVGGYGAQPSFSGAGHLHCCRAGGAKGSPSSSFSDMAPSLVCAFDRMLGPKSIHTSRIRRGFCPIG